MFARVAIAVAVFFLFQRAASAAPYCASQESGATPSQLAQSVEGALGPSPIANLGPVGLTLIGELQSQLCEDASIREFLPNTCAPMESLDGVRARLVVDLLAVPSAALQNRGAALSHEQRLAVAYLVAVTAGVEPHEVAHRAAYSLGLATSDCSPPNVGQADPVAIATGLVWILTDPAGNPAARGETETQALIVATLNTVRGGAPLSPAESALLQPLAAQAAQTFAWYGQWKASPTNVQALSQLLLAEFTLFQRALSLALARNVSLPPEAWALTRDILDADVDGAIEELRNWLVARGELDGEMVEAAAKVSRLLRARSEDEALRIVRGFLTPWDDNILFSASGGVPQLQSDNFNIVGEGTLGYQADAWGLVAGGGASVLEFESDTYIATTVKLFGNGDGWFSLPLGDRGHLDIRGTFDFAIFDSETIVNEDVILSAEETSLLLRGGAQLGARYQGPTYALGAWAGGGGQLEWYDQRSTVASEAGAPTQLRDLSALSGVFHGRTRVQWAFVPSVLALRLSLDAKLYKMARMSSVIDTTVPAADILAETDEEAIQLEALGRGFIDLEVARFFGFVPGAGVGIDHYQLAVSGQATQVVTIPIYFLGVRRTTF
jgi:hypothetical protein